MNIRNAMVSGTEDAVTVVLEPHVLIADDATAARADVLAALRPAGGESP